MPPPLRARLISAALRLYTSLSEAAALCNGPTADAVSLDSSLTAVISELLAGSVQAGCFKEWGALAHLATALNKQVVRAFAKDAPTRRIMQLVGQQQVSQWLSVLYR
jgi:hypothetical protein